MSTAIFFGGVSFEHEISIVSAITMKKVLKDKMKFIFVDENRKMFLIPNDKMKSNLFSSKQYEKCKEVFFKQGGIYTRGILKNKNIEYDVVLNLSHGGDGEDGTLSSMFKFYNIPFIGPNTQASVVSSNKYLTKLYSKSKGVNVISYSKFTTQKEPIITQYPVIVKPLNLGSSIGVSVVKNQKELSYALDVAYEFDKEVIIEPFIPNIKEYNLAGTMINDEFVFSIIEEPYKEEFLDFDKKYMDFNRSETVNKASISEELELKLKDCFKKLYKDMFEGSIIRCDFFVINNEVCLNEINSIPGSMANYLFEDFNTVLKNLSHNLPKQRKIKIDYLYVNKIQKAKGKAS